VKSATIVLREKSPGISQRNSFGDFKELKPRKK
jgi:hypothetical protein